MHYLTTRMKDGFGEILQRYMQNSAFHSNLLYCFAHSEWNIASEKYESAASIARMFSSNSLGSMITPFYEASLDNNYTLRSMKARTLGQVSYIDRVRGVHPVGRYDAILHAMLFCMNEVQELLKSDLPTIFDECSCFERFSLILAEYIMVLSFDLTLARFEGLKNELKNPYYLKSGVNALNVDRMQKVYIECKELFVSFEDSGINLRKLSANIKHLRQLMKNLEGINPYFIDNLDSIAVDIDSPSEDENWHDLIPRSEEIDSRSYSNVTVYSSDSPLVLSTPSPRL